MHHSLTMRFASLVSLVLLVAFAAIGDCKSDHQGSPSTGVTEHRSLGSMDAKRSSEGTYKNMLLRNIYTHSFRDSSGTLKRAATCKSCHSHVIKHSIAAIRALANCNSHVSQLERPKLQY